MNTADDDTPSAPTAMAHRGDSRPTVPNAATQPRTRFSTPSAFPQNAAAMHNPSGTPAAGPVVTGN
ncbi:hypothetical protein GCM10022220_66070 [Actinocatenispora rupis]|uniref:Uncharacterized protein n=1 Tax=Actinocatenispora rupis TaxID=519421 RepID=A0A8J3JCY6_9ACTN|nr:hypothetical protein Aru02nite_69400 [Actinocatenispora rupis]